ncbi:MAG: hypothetical protein V4773_28180, partial [Verrucomicrobiota bacterium]
PMDIPPSLPPPLAAPPAAPFRDRHTGLIVFGGLLIAIGAFFGLTIPMMLLGQMQGRVAGNVVSVEHVPHDFKFILPGLVMMTAGATACIWLGIGSIKARRWARALILCGSWFALCTGILSLFQLPGMLAAIDHAVAQQVGAGQPPGVMLVFKVMMVVMMLAYIAVPGAFVLFYRSPHVRHTCEVRDPVERWTDRCPLPVLPVCLLQSVGALSLLFTPAFGGAFPIGSFVLAGWPARLVWLAFGAFSFYAARGFYRCDLRVWRVYLIVVAVFGANGAVSLHLLGMEGYYRASGFSEEQLAVVLQSPMVRSNSMLWVGLLSGGCFLGYLIYIRRYFRKVN